MGQNASTFCRMDCLFQSKASLWVILFRDLMGRAASWLNSLFSPPLLPCEEEGKSQGRDAHSKAQFSSVQKQTSFPDSLYSLNLR